MQKILLFFIVFGAFCLQLHGFDINSIKNTNSYVIDQSNILSESEKQSLEQKIISIQEKYTAEILLLITPTTSGESISNLATQVGQELGVGKKDTDNGIVILIALQDRSWNIATGYGVEGVLPDLLVNKIGNKNFALFKEEKYFEGILGSLNDIDRVLAKDPTIISEIEQKAPNIELLIFLFFGVFGFSSLYLKSLYKDHQYKKIFIAFFIGYLITLPIAFFVIGVISFGVNLGIWLIAMLTGISGSHSGLYNIGSSILRGGGSGRSGGGFGGGGFGGGGSSGKW